MEVDPALPNLARRRGDLPQGAGAHLRGRAADRARCEWSLGALAIKRKLQRCREATKRPDPPPGAPGLRRPPQDEEEQQQRQQQQGGDKKRGGDYDAVAAKRRKPAAPGRSDGAEASKGGGSSALPALSSMVTMHVTVEPLEGDRFCFLPVPAKAAPPPGAIQVGCPPADPGGVPKAPQI